MDNLTVVLVGVLAMLIMAMGIIAFVILYKRRVIENQLEIERINNQVEQDMLKATLLSEETERKRIAAELHDDIGATLASVKLYLYHIKADGAQEERLKSAKDLLDQTIQNVRNISHKLQPTILDQLGLEKALSSYANIWNQSGGVRVNYQPCAAAVVLPKGADLQLYRTIQELVTNIIRHGQAQHIDISMEEQTGSYLLRMLHDGSGMDQASYMSNLRKEGSTGLKNIQNRLRILQADIQHNICLKDKKSEILVKIPRKMP